MTKHGILAVKSLASDERINRQATEVRVFARRGKTIHCLTNSPGSNRVSKTEKRIRIPNAWWLVSNGVCRKLLTLFGAAEVKARILVVVGDHVNQMIFSWYLTSLGYECDVVGTSDASFKAVTEKSYSLIFMDLNIPDSGGFNASRRMRESGFVKPIIAVTTEAETKTFENFRKCLDSGMNGYLAKPFYKSDFEDVFKRWLASAVSIV